MDAISLSKKYVDLLRSNGISVDQAYLFGSHAKGKIWEGSDIDVCVVSKFFGKNYQSEKSILNKTALKVDPRIEAVAYSTDDFANKYDSLADEIKRFGINLV